MFSGRLCWVGLLKSINGGTNWALLGVSNFVPARRMFELGGDFSIPEASVRGVSGVSGSSFPSASPVGIYKSTDGGTNWSLKLDAQLM